MSNTHYAKGVMLNQVLEAQCKKHFLFDDKLLSKFTSDHVQLFEIYSKLMKRC